MRAPELIIKNNTDYEKTILTVGVFHGDEPQGEGFIRDYLDDYTESGKNRMFFIPRLNPSLTRVNENGVDLNRNFPTKNWQKTEAGEFFGGDKPASEVQTRFLVELIEKNRFDAIVTIHAPFKIINYDGAQSLPVAKKAAQILAYPLQEDIGYPTPGSFGTYCGIERKIPTLTIEIDENAEPAALSGKFSKFFKWLENEF